MMLLIRLPLLFLALSLCLIGPPRGTAQQVAQNTPAPDIDRAALIDYLRYVNLWPAQVQVEIESPLPSSLLPGFFDLGVKISAGQAQLTQKYLLSPDGQHLVRAQSGDRLGKTVFDTTAYPFASERGSLSLEGLPSAGPAEAPITITVFSDFQCGFCREEAKILRSNLSKSYPDKVRLVFHDFPLAQIHDWANTAAVAGRCVAAQNPPAFWTYHDWIFDEQPAITAANLPGKLADWAVSNSIDSLQLNRCIASPEMNQAVAASFQRAVDMGLNSTPTLFVNGRQLGGRLEWAALKQVVDIELDYQEKLAKKKEECCTVTLPGIFNQ